MNKNTITYIFILSLVSSLYFGLFLYHFIDSGFIDSDGFTLYSYTYWTISLVGGLFGLIVSNVWGRLQSVTGKSLFWLSMGLLLQSIGQIIYAYLTVIQGIEDPYPSIAEIFFVSSIPAYIIGSYYIAKLSGLSSDIKTTKFKIFGSITAILLMWFAYSQFINSHDTENTSIILLFLEIIYPFGQSLFIAITLFAFFLNKNLRGGALMNRIFFVLFGLLSQYLADTFYDRTPVQFSDMLYIYSYFLISLGLILFNETSFKSMIKTKISSNIENSKI